MLKGCEPSTGLPALFVATSVFTAGFGLVGDVFCWDWAAACNAKSDTEINQQRSIYKGHVFVIIMAFLSSRELNSSRFNTQEPVLRIEPEATG
jgi:hypothetical protein